MSGSASHLPLVRARDSQRSRVGQLDQTRSPPDTPHYAQDRAPVHPDTTDSVGTAPSSTIMLPDPFPEGLKHPSACRIMASVVIKRRFVNSPG
jgi:hypothetical protein